MVIELRCEKRRITVNPKDIEFIDAGGQGPIYKWSNMTLKFHEDDSILRKMVELRKRLKAYQNLSNARPMPKGLAERTFMVCTGTAEGSDIGTPMRKHLFVLGFNWLEGSKFDYSLKVEQSVRVDMASVLVNQLLYLEKLGVVHADINPSNYLVDKDNVPHMIDIEGAGLLHGQTGNWLYRPAVLGKKVPGFISPPEAQTQPPTVDQYTDRWFGLILVTCMLAGASPFFFLTRADKPSLTEFRDCAIKGFQKTSLVVWPPEGIENHQHLQEPIRNSNTMEKLRKLWGKFAKGRLVPLLFNTFVRGMNNPKKRSSFNMMKTRLGLR